MYRDFSENSKQKLLGLVSEVENEKLCDFTDWIGDRWYDFEAWIGRLDIKNYLNNVNTYHKKVIDKNNATKKEIEKIFRDVMSIDELQQKQLLSAKLSITKWYDYIKQMDEIVKEKGKFTKENIEFSMKEVLDKYSVYEDDFKLSSYVEINRDSGNYFYHWDEIENLLSKDYSEMSEEDYKILLFVLSTMMDKEGNIDVGNLEKFINAGYTKPSSVTSDDYHVSFERMANGDKVEYYYVQNKSYMTDTLKVLVALYETACEKANVEGRMNNLNELMRTVVENYSVVEWRWNINPSRDYWSGKNYISESDLAKFNDRCKARISIDFVNNTDGSGMDYYCIKSNAYNGNVRTATSDGRLIERNNVKDDNYSDCTIRLYVDCANANADTVAVILKGKSIIAQDYQEFDFQNILCDEAINIVAKYAPFGGTFISSLYDISKQTEAVSVIMSEINAVKSVELNQDIKISAATEKRLDIGMNEVNRALGIYAKYKAVEENNKKVQENQEALESFAKQHMVQKNLGLEYNTMVVRYNHCDYNDDGRGIKVDGDKNCDKATDCDISPSNYQYNADLLRKQYNAVMHTTISDSAFLELEKQVKEYMIAGKVAENTVLSNYIAQWED